MGEPFGPPCLPGPPKSPPRFPVRPMPSRYDYDVIVIGAGHAGVEAACAAARLGAATALLTTNCDTVGQMSCNPAIGGVGKAQLVREVDALGGIMARAIDATGIQFRVLNRSKGPAMHGPRAQADKKLYQMEVKRLVEETPNLDLRQETVEDLLVEPAPPGPGHAAWRVTGVRVRGAAEYHAPAVVLTTGTFLQAVMHTGEAQTPGGAGRRRNHCRGEPVARRPRLSARTVQNRHALSAARRHDRLCRIAGTAGGYHPAALLISD